MNNRFRIGQAAESIGVVKLSGFAMYARVDYPYVLASGNPADEITVELVRITNPDIVNRMCDFESGEGYFPVLVNAADFTAWIFMFSNPGQDPRIQGGDWVKAGIP